MWCEFFMSVFLRCLFNLKVSYTDANIPSAESLPRWPQQPKLTWAKLVPGMSSGCPTWDQMCEHFGCPLIILTGCYQGAGSEEGQMGQEPVSFCDAVITGGALPQHIHTLSYL